MAKTTTITNDPKAGATETPEMDAPPKNTLSYFEEKLRKARLKLAEAKAEHAKLAERGRRIRERAVGRIMLELIDAGRVDEPVIATLREEVKKSCSTLRQLVAFAHTIFN